MEDLLQRLNESQRKAVEYTDGPALVIAGAGSGKTRVLTYKIAWLLQNGYQPYQILALTFTNKAAREMKERIAAMVGHAVAARLWMGTFHSIFSRILRANAERLRFAPTFTIYDSADSRSLIKAIIKEKGLDDKVYKPATVQALISNAKNALITADAYAAHKELVESDFRAKRPELKNIYKLYQVRCFRAGAMDFDDLLLYTNILFRDCPDVTERYRDLFAYILVDEYQDTNFAQHLIVQQLARKHNRLCVVGDDAQSIYSFRGANISNILSIRTEYPDCRIFKLEQNYRSTQNIVEAANSLIEKNKGQIPKHIFSCNAEGSRLTVLNAYSDFEEGYLVAGRLMELRMTTHDSFNDFAILYRTNAQSRIFEEALRKRNIPYRIYGGLSFYQRKEIKDVIAYFRMAVNPNDEEALKRIINYPSRGIGETTLSKIASAASTHDASMWQVIEDPVAYALPVNNGTMNKLIAFRELIRSFVESADRMNVLELAEKIIRQSGIFTDVYSDRSVESLSKQENIQELMNGIQEFVLSRQEEGNEEIGLVDFLAEISLSTDQDGKEDADAEKVTMMTIHAAKGLEFNNVFVVGLEEDLFPSALAKGSEPELEEERRLFYVAITRARNHCFLSYASTRFRNGQTMASPPSRFIKDIDSKYLNLPAGLGAEEKIADRSRTFAERLQVYASGMQRPARQKERIVSESVMPKRLVRLEQAVVSKEGEKGGGTEWPAGLTEGVRIRHDRFGIGTVDRIEGSGDNCKVSVEFEHVGKKQLLLKFAKFTIISE